MNKYSNIKERILTDDKFAKTMEYLMSKVVLDKPLPTLWFIYKKHKIVLGRNGLYTVYSPEKRKIATKIHFQEVAKYIVDNVKSPEKIKKIREAEDEMFRHREKIEFFTQYNTVANNTILEAKIDSMWNYYHVAKNSLLTLLNRKKFW